MSASTHGILIVGTSAFRFLRGVLLRLAGVLTVLAGGRLAGQPSRATVDR